MGQSGLSDGLNTWLYRTGTRTLSRFSRELDLASVYEAGAGTGYWTSYWLGRGARQIDGCDVVPLAVHRLNERFGATGRFAAADLSAPTFPADGRYSTVTAMNVLLHITDEAGFRRALGHLARIVQPGGHLLVADPVMLVGESWVAATSRTRSLGTCVDALRHEGLDYVGVAPTTVLGADPIEARSRLESAVSLAWWRLVTGADRRGLGRLAGLAIYLLDPLPLKIGWAPSGKFLLFRRPRATPSSA